MKDKVKEMKSSKRLAAIGATVALAVTLLSGSVFAATSSATASATTSTNQYIGEAKAKSIALQNAGVSEAQATILNAHLDRDHGRVVYDVEFYSGNTEYDYEIDAVSGDIRKSGKDVENNPVPAGNYIGDAKAKSIALEHAGLSESQTTFIGVHLDRDHGIVVYDVEFYSGATEFDYEIDAASGSIREHSRETNNNSANTSYASNTSAATQPSGNYIGEAKAQSIALSTAGLSASQAVRMKVEFDYEHGSAVYEVEFRDSGRMEYEYEVDAVNGTILESDVEYDD
jgi:uncharacterized membrane protein YkoI